MGSKSSWYESNIYFYLSLQLQKKTVAFRKLAKRQEGRATNVPEC